MGDCFIHREYTTSGSSISPRDFYFNNMILNGRIDDETDKWYYSIFTHNCYFTAPHTGNYYVTCVGGGAGALSFWTYYNDGTTNHNCEIAYVGGGGGYVNQGNISLTEGYKYTVYVGMGGKFSDNSIEVGNYNTNFVFDGFNGGYSLFANKYKALGGRCGWIEYNGHNTYVNINVYGGYGGSGGGVEFIYDSDNSGGHYSNLHNPIVDTYNDSNYVSGHGGIYNRTYYVSSSDETTRYAIAGTNTLALDNAEDIYDPGPGLAGTGGAWAAGGGGYGGNGSNEEGGGGGGYGTANYGAGGSKDKNGMPGAVILQWLKNSE